MNVWEVFKGIKAKFDSVTATGSAYALTGGRLRYSQARQEDTLPYVVFSGVDVVYDWTNDSEINTFRVQFSIFSDEASASEASLIADALTILFDQSLISAAGFFAIACTRDSSNLYKDEEYWRFDVDYILRYQQSTTTTTTTTGA